MIYVINDLREDFIYHGKSRKLEMHIRVWKKLFDSQINKIVSHIVKTIENEVG